MAFGERQYGGMGGGSGLGIGLPPLTKAVRVLLIANVALFVLQVIPAVDRGLVNWLAVSVGTFWQPWRYVTFQFLHADFWHIALNMLGLYLLGSPLEQHWGPRRFLAFYLACGAFSGMTYVAVSAAVGDDRFTPIIGASGGIFAILLACAVLFPQFKLILLFFPVPIRLAALIIFGGMVFIVLSSLRQGVHSSSFWSDSCHLGGAAAAAFYLWVLPAVGGIRLRRTSRGGPKAGSGAWKRRMDNMAAEQEQIDRILQKIHDQGLNSLTDKEKHILRDATKRQREEDQRVGKL